MMHDHQGQLPKDFLTFDDAIKLIKAETRNDPKIDIDFMARNICLGTLTRGHTFQIPLLGINAKERKIERIGVRYVLIKSDYEATILEHTILEKYRELAKKEFTQEIKKTTTVVNDTDNTRGVLLEDIDSTRRMGDEI